MKMVMVVSLGIQIGLLGLQAFFTFAAEKNWQASRKQLKEADEVMAAIKKLATVVDKFNMGQLLNFPSGGQHGKNVN